MASWRRLLRVPWTARRSRQSILKGINPEYSLEGLMLRLKLQYFGHLMRRAHSLEKTLMLGKIEGRRGRGRQRMRWLDSVIDSMDMSLRKLCETVKDGSLVFCSPWGRKESDTTSRLNNSVFSQLWEAICLNRANCKGAQLWSTPSASLCCCFLSCPVGISVGPPRAWVVVGLNSCYKSSA